MNSLFQNHTPSTLNFSGFVHRLRRLKRSYGEYETEGRRFYSLAKKHHAASGLELRTIFSSLKNNFEIAKKPLQFMALHYLHSKKIDLFEYQV